MLCNTMLAQCHANIFLSGLLVHFLCHSISLLLLRLLLLHHRRVCIYQALFSSIATLLVLPRSLLTSLQLLQVPATDVHVSTVLLHTLRKGLDVTCTRARCAIPLAGRLRVVQTGVHRLAGLRVGVDWLLVLRLLLLCRSSGGAAAKESADGVADGGTDCDTTVEIR